MSRPSKVSPSECPKPFWHTTHRYCPCCTWTEDFDEDTEADSTQVIEVWRTGPNGSVGCGGTALFAGHRPRIVPGPATDSEGSP